MESGENHTNRPQLTVALAECRKRRAVLVIAKLDRLARNVHFIFRPTKKLPKPELLDLASRLKREGKEPRAIA